MKYYLKALSAFVIIACLTSIDATARKSDKVIWQIGEKDGSAEGFALSPDGFKDFIEHDFGYEDKFFLIGWSDPAKDFPYVLPGPADTWGGTWSTAGWRTHCVNILFDLGRKPVDKGKYVLKIHLADHATKFLPLVKISLNEKEHKVQLTKEGVDLSLHPAPGTTEPVTDTLGITGNLSGASACTIEMPLNGEYLRKGPNILTISVLDGSWILFDQIELLGPSRIKVRRPHGVFVRDVKAADYQLGDDIQPLLVDIEHLEGDPSLEIKVDGKTILKKNIEQGRYILEAPMASVKESVKSSYKVLVDGRKVASGTVLRSSRQNQTPAGYVDTRTGTAHSRWMIAPGPWMPFSMVKMSPDNQNSGWQSGYQPSFESIGCFSHIHEWTMAGLGIMAANGPLMTKVGDQRKDDEGYRSRIDKRSEKAGIGYYSALLTDYDILAEVTATTRCGFERFTFPADRGEGRIIMEFKPQAEYGIIIKDACITKVSDTRLEGYCHIFSPNVWSRDADQDYRLHFVIEFDRPVKRIGCWSDGRIEENVSDFKWGECDAAGVFAVFDPEDGEQVQVRSGISLVSVANAAENLEKEVILPFGWDFEAVMNNNIATWNDIFARIEIDSDDALEKSRFYNNMYRAVCSRNIWSDVNGEWISTDGSLHKVENPEEDVMLGCDAFWNTFWNLNQFWNLVTPEWSRRWVRSQLAMYEANGRLAKGPAGLNYIPVMVAEHEIPLIVSAWQMGIRGFDPEKALEASVKMQTTPAGKVFKGFAGNRDLVHYMKYHYVPYDKGRFSNSMEYSFDDWTVGQLAKSIGKEDVYDVFNDRGYWWKNVIDDEGYCHMKDSDGNWMEGFDPFRSGANRQYVEGNAWQLTFFVPQDVPALVEMIGQKRFTERLLWGFNQDEAWRYNAPNDQYWDHPVVQGNQQSMHFAYLFNYAGQPWNTQRWSRSILDRYYGYGVANAYLGDEDQGQMSAWAVMTSLGLFQIDGGCNAEPQYEIASPIFPETVIHLDGREGRGDRFVIKANGASRKNIYVQSARLNGKEWNSFKFPASELLGGGTLELEMGPEPNKEWGLQ
ncbi:MAG: GH92 family glycosyl hydrolase [Bacteroidales bacterium]|nr:GH92 family glycosyl hydrolase [Bacteroidales bacterium]